MRAQLNQTLYHHQRSPAAAYWNVVCVRASAAGNGVSSSLFCSICSFPKLHGVKKNRTTAIKDRPRSLHVARWTHSEPGPLHC